MEYLIKDASMQVYGGQFRKCLRIQAHCKYPAGNVDRMIRHNIIGIPTLI